MNIAVPISPEKKHGYRPILILLHAVFLLSGITTVIIGQVLPIISRRFSLNDLESAYFFPAQFSGSVLGTFFTSWFGRNHKYLLATTIGCLAMAVGLLLMNADSRILCLFGFFMNGIGIGLALPSINMLILEMNPTHAASALNVLNFCWGVGAILCKPFIDTFSGGTSILTATLLLAVPLAASAALTRSLGKGIEVMPTGEPELQPSSVPIWTTPLAWLLALFNFIHVGFESGIGGWLTTYSGRIDYVASVQVLSPTFIYFVFFVAGRGIAPVLFRFFSENSSMLISLIIILLGLGITLGAGSAVGLSIGAALSGFGTSTVFPTSLARFGRIFGSGAPRRAMPLFISGTAGSIVIAWLIGFFSNRLGDLRLGMYVLVVGIGFLIALQIVIGLRTTRN